MIKINLIFGNYTYAYKWIILLCFKFVNTYSQMILPYNKASYFKLIETDYSYKYCLINNRDSVYLESKYYYIKDAATSRKKVGIQFNYFPSGMIKQIGYYGAGIDTFSIDSNNIIIFNNPNPNYHLIYSSKIIEKIYNSKSENNGYTIEIVPSNWNIEFDSSGNISSHCIEDNNTTVVIKYNSKTINYYRYKNNKKIEEWFYKKGDD